MSDLQQYSGATAYIDAGCLTEETGLTIKRMSGAQVVKTCAKGFAGLSPGAKMMNVSVKNAVPSADFELNPGPFMGELRVAELTIFAAGKTLTSKGFITEDNFSHAVDTPSALDFEFIGQWADWE